MTKRPVPAARKCPLTGLAVISTKQDKLTEE
jgi:hypothetical protein